MKKIFATALAVWCALSLWAQSGTNSPYSQFGLGTLAPQSTSFNRGMNGLSYGFYDGNQINFQNPASYANLDSLTFLFDAGLSLQLTNFEENGRKKNAQNGNIEYVAAAFRAFPRLGVSFGLMPYTNVGYNYSNTQNINAFPETSSASATYTNTFSGSGGLHQAYVGLGWQPLKGLSVGGNFSYLWGTLNRNVVNTYSDTYVNTLSKIYEVDVRSYKLDFGLQYTARISKKDKLTLGLVYSLGHKLNADPQVNVISKNSQTSVSDTTKFVIHDALELPHTFGAGLMWNRDNRIRIGFDYELQKWQSIDMPEFSITNGVGKYSLVSGQFKNRQKFTLGGEYTKGKRYGSLLNRIRYRAGVSYATPYLYIGGKEGPREISASVGFGIPLTSGYSDRSILSISGEWVNQTMTGAIKENMFRINIGLTFNERWFAKFKVK